MSSEFRVIPEILELFKTAAQKVVTLRFPTSTEAKNFRTRMYEVRSSMRKNEMIERLIADRVEFKLRGNTVIAQPFGHDYQRTITAALEDAGSTLPSTENQITEEEKSKLDRMTSAIENYANKELEDDEQEE